MSHLGGGLLYWICSHQHANTDRLSITSYMVTCGYCLAPIDRDLVYPYGWTELGHKCQGRYGNRPTTTRVWCRPCGRIHDAHQLTNSRCLRLEDNDLATDEYFRCAPRMVRLRRL